MSNGDDNRSVFLQSEDQAVGEIGQNLTSVWLPDGGSGTWKLLNGEETRPYSIEEPIAGTNRLLVVPDRRSQHLLLCKRQHSEFHGFALSCRRVTSTASKASSATCPLCR